MGFVRSVFGPAKAILLCAALCSGCAEAEGDNASDAAAGDAGEALDEGICPSLATPMVDAGALSDPAADRTSGVAAELVVDEFGPHAEGARQLSPLSRLNVYEITKDRQLVAFDVYVAPAAAGTRLSLAVHEARDRDSDFDRVFFQLIDAPICEGYLRVQLRDVTLKADHYYAIGFDPTQGVGVFNVSEAGSLPVDGSFGRLIGSRTNNTVSTETLDWKGFGTRDYYRQRLFTSELAPGPDAGAPDAGSQAAADASSEPVQDAATDS